MPITVDTVEENFHTIKSILNLPEVVSSLGLSPYFHTIKSILNTGHFQYQIIKVLNFHTIKSILN